MGRSLDHSKESVLTKDFDVPHFLTHYPKIAKPFYHRVDPSDENYVLCHDLLAPEATVKSLAAASERGRRKKFWSGLTRRDATGPLSVLH